MMRHKRGLYSAVAVVLTGAMVVTSIHFSKQDVCAKETFQGITDIVASNSEENPFTIFEVVPGDAEYKLGTGDEEITVKVPMGILGYYIKGSEPCSFDKVLPLMKSQKVRKEYAELFLKGDESAPTGGILLDIAGTDTNSKPLKYTGYEENYLYRLTDEDLQQAYQDGNPWNELDMSLDENHEEHIYEDTMTISENGHFLKKYSTSENEIKSLDELAPDRALDYSAMQDGDFDPNFAIDGDGEYIVKFVANTAKRGYRVTDHVRVYKDSADVGDNTPIYTVSDNGIFVYQGTYAELKPYMDDAPEAEGNAGKIEDDDDNDQEAEADGVEEEASDDEEETAGDGIEEENDDNTEDALNSAEEEASDDESKDNDSSDGDSSDKDSSNEGSSDSGSDSAKAVYPIRPVAMHAVDTDIEGANASDDSEEEASDDEIIEEEGDDIYEEEVVGVEELEEDVVEEISDDEIEPVDSEIDATGEDFVPEDGAYYAIAMTYSMEYSEDEVCYSVMEAYKGSDSLVKYSLNADELFVANFDKTGYITDTGLFPHDFVYDFTEETDEITGEKRGAGNCELIADADDTEYIRVTGLTVCYRGPFVNNEWFTKFVFDRDFSMENGEVFEEVFYTYACITPEELSSGIYNAAEAGLLYISNPDGSFVPAGYESIASYGPSNQLTNALVQDIVGAVVMHDLPVMIDLSVLNGLRGCDGTTMQKLAQILQQENYEGYYYEHQDESPTEFISHTLGDYFNDDKDSHHVNNSFYMYKDDKPSLNNAFLELFGEALVETCFQEIIDEIQNENNFRELEKIPKSEWIPEEVNEAVAIKYIISFANRKSANLKDEINVLELQPMNVKGDGYLDLDSNNSDSKYDDLLDDKVESNLYVLREDDGTYTLYRRGKSDDDSKDTKLIKGAKNKINLVSMSTSEFVGHEEDLNGEYDLIYFGMSTKFMHVKSDTERETRYNDSSMDGLIYTNIGDESKVYSWTHLGNIKSSGDTALTRYSGNDISSYKVTALKEYVKAGYPVIVDYHFYDGDEMTSDTVDTDYVDESSYLYSFLDYMGEKPGINNNKNVFRLDKNGKIPNSLTSKLQWYLELPKPHIENDESYATTEHTKQLNGDDERSDGTYRMEWRFAITDKASTDPDTRYDAQLYIDGNSDGKFCDEELVSAFEIADQSKKRIDGQMRYELKAGKDYYAYFTVTDEYDGPLPWKLVVSVNKDEKRRDTLTGCYSIHRKNAPKIPIYALQILPDDYQSQSLGWVMDSSRDGGEVNAIFERLYTSLEHYDVHVVSKTSKELIDDFDADPKTLDQYQLIILGFFGRYAIFQDAGYGDAFYRDGAVEAQKALVNYIKSGRSTMISAGVINDSIPNLADWGKTLTKDIRDVAGQDRYGVTSDSGSRIDHAKAYEPGSSSTVDEIHGLTNHKIDTIHNSTYTSSTAEKNFQASVTLGNVTPYILNRGQLTMYPYSVSDFKVLNQTNYIPPYSLNFEEDEDDDEQGDVMVWCTCGKVMGDYQKNDARDFYYLYTKKNITFINAVTHAEAAEQTFFELIVNTMIASYEAGVRVPRVKIVEEPSTMSNEIDSINIPFDYSVADVQYTDADTQDVYFFVTGVDKNASLMTNFYYEVDSEAAADKTVLFGKATVYLKAFTPIMMRENIEGKLGKVITPGTVTVGKGSGAKTITGYPTERNVPYQFTVPLTLLNGKDSIPIYAETSSLYDRGNTGEANETVGYDRVEIVKTQLFSLD